MRRAIFIAMGVLAATGPARAQDSDGRKAVAVFVVGGPSLSSAHEATLLLTMEKALENDRRLEVVDRDRALAERAGQVPEDVISEARGLLESGEALLRQGKAQPALLRLQAAENQLAAHLSWVPKNELARAQFLVGAALAVAGKRDAAAAAFGQLQVWRPDFVVDTDIAPGTVIPLWEKVRKKTDALPRGSVEIKSKPDRALAYVDGRFVGFTPTTDEALPVGDHYVTLRKVGYARRVLKVTVSASREQTVRGSLQRIPGADGLVEQARTAARLLGRARGPDELTVIGAALEADHLLFVRVPATSAGGKYEAFLYEATSRRRLAAATVAADPEKEIDSTFGELARALYAQVVFDPPPPKKPVVARRRSGSVWSRWWLWTGLGVAAAAAVAVPLTIGASGSSGPSCPGSSICGEIVIGP